MDLKIEHEGDIVNLIGVNTLLKFSFISDCIVTFETINPILIDDCYCDFEIEFFVEEVETIQFFCYDSFSNFLLKYKIYKLTYKVGEVNKLLYERKYS